MGVILQVIVIALPVMLFPSNPNADFLAAAVIRFVTASAVLFPIFLPKIVFFLHDRKTTELRLQERTSRSTRLKRFMLQMEQIQEVSKEEHEIVFGFSTGDDSGLQILGHARRSSLKRSLSDLGSGIVVRNHDSSNHSISLRQESPENSISDDKSSTGEHSTSLENTTEPKYNESASFTTPTSKEKECHSTKDDDAQIAISMENYQEGEIVMVDEELHNGDQSDSDDSIVFEE